MELLVFIRAVFYTVKRICFVQFKYKTRTKKYKVTKENLRLATNVIVIRIFLKICINRKISYKRTKISSLLIRFVTKLLSIISSRLSFLDDVGST